MNHFVKKFEKPNREDPIRIFEEFWKKNDSVPDCRSAYGMVVIGSPAKQVEFLSLGLHKFYSHAI
jgi:hypothetical protein